MPSEIVTEGVLLELGRRGGTLPQQTKSLSSMIAHHAVDSGLARPDEFDEFTPFEMKILAPERTLVEKLLLVHQLAVRSDATAARAGGRHLYDVCKLLTDDDTLDALRSEPDLVARITEDALAQSERWGFDAAPRPEGGFAASPAFDAAGPTIDALREGYRAAKPLIYREIPSFHECVQVVHASARLL